MIKGLPKKSHKAQNINLSKVIQITACLHLRTRNFHKFLREKCTQSPQENINLSTITETFSKTKS